MIYTIGSVILAIGSLLTWIYGLLQHNKDLKFQIELAKHAADTKEWADKIAASQGRVTEDVKDYGDAVNQFNNNNK